MIILKYARILIELFFSCANDEYYVMGDNWSASTDCYEKSSVEKLTKSYLQGRVISITANVSYYNNVTSNMHEISERHDF